MSRKTIAVVCSDVHAGNHKRFGGATEASLNERCRHVLDVFDRACAATIASGAGYMIVAGDLFDVARPEPSLLARVQTALRNLREEGVEPILLVGNHEKTSTAVGDNALAPLRDHARVIYRPELIDDPHVEIICVPFLSGPVNDWLRGAIGQALQSSTQKGDVFPLPTPRMLVLHMGIKDERTPPWLKDSTGAVDVDVLADICGEYGITQVYAGDWHERRQWLVDDDPQATVHIMQVGALVPTGFDNPGLSGYGTLAFYDGVESRYEELAGPRFVKVQDADEAKSALKKAKAAGHRLYVSASMLPGEMEASTKRLSKEESLGGFEVLPDREMAQVEARQAASRASSAETLHEALDAFVKNMPIADGVSRDAVLERTRLYLK